MHMISASARQRPMFIDPLGYFATLHNLTRAVASGLPSSLRRADNSLARWLIERLDNSVTPLTRKRDELLYTLSACWRVSEREVKLR